MSKSFLHRFARVAPLAGVTPSAGVVPQKGADKSAFLQSVLFMVVFVVLSVGMYADAQVVTDTLNKNERHLRGRIAQVGATSMVVDARGGAVKLSLPDPVTVLKLSKASFSDVIFGTYVGSVSKRLAKYSPIVRDSLSWLHLGYELRIFDESLRGLALGHTKWDLNSESVISHGWVDDMEVRVLSIKYGPTEEEETDVDIPHDVPILRLSLGERALLVPGANVFVGAEGGEVSFVMVGEGGIVPPL